MNRGTSRRDYLKMMAATAGLATAAPLAFAQEDAAKKSAQQVPPLGHERRIQWWQEAKFGMFIHWGLYSVIGRHEWAMEVEGIPIPQYELLAKQFDPKPNASRDWARLATQAGLMYVMLPRQPRASLFPHAPSRRAPWRRTVRAARFLLSRCS